MKRVQRLIRRVVDFGGVSRLTTVQTTNLYSFTERRRTLTCYP